jgi:hypothetical protein
MSESGFAIGESQSSRYLVNNRENSSWKVIPGKQQWTIAIEYISAGGSPLPPLLIFMTKHTHEPLDWRFSRRDSGWMSGRQAYEWLTTVLEPST